MVSILVPIFLLFMRYSHGEIDSPFDSNKASNGKVYTEKSADSTFEDDSWFIKWHAHSEKNHLHLPDSMIVPMVTVNKEHFSCSITKPPPPDNTDEGSLGDSPWKQLRQLHSEEGCIYRVESYWMYELCHGKHVRQVHADKSSNKKSKLEFYLGRYSPENLERDELAYNEMVGADSNFVPNKMKFGNTFYPFFEVVYNGGTLCDLTGEFRITRVRYICHGSIMGYQMSDIVEIASCQYQMIVLSPKLCNIPAYRVEPKVARPIHCVAANSAMLPYPRALLRLESSALQQRGHALLSLIDSLDTTSPELAKSVLSVQSALGPLKSAIDEWVASDDGAGGNDRGTGTGGGGEVLEREMLEVEVETSRVDRLTVDAIGSDSVSDMVGQQLLPESASDTARQKSSADSASDTARRKSSTNTASATDQELIVAILSGKKCLYEQQSNFRVEFCYGRHVRKYYDNQKVQTLGVFDREAHLEWFHQLKPTPLSQALELDSRTGKRIAVSHLYTQGSSCSSSDVNNQRQVQVEFRCEALDGGDERIAVVLLEFGDCKGLLLVRGLLLCAVIADTDESTGLLPIPSTISSAKYATSKSLPTVSPV